MAEEAKQVEETATKQDIYTPMLISADDIDLESKESEEKDEKVESKQEDDVEIEVEGKGDTKVDKEEDKVSSLQREISSLKDEILKLSTRKPEKIVEKKEKKEERLTLDQIVGVIEESKDKPNFSTILTNAIKYIAEDVASGIKDKTMEEVSHKQWASNLSGTANQILSSDEDGYLAANPKIKGELDDMASNLGLGDHPAGKFAAYAIFRYLEGVKATKEKGAKDKESKTSETKTRTMDKTRASSASGKVELTPEQRATAKKLGVKESTYAMFVKKS